MALTYRLIKGSALTHQEGDDNLSYLLLQSHQAQQTAASAVAAATGIAADKLNAKLNKHQIAMAVNQMLDCALGNIFDMTIGQDSAVDFSNSMQGQLYHLLVTQTNGGGHNMSFVGANWKGITSLSITPDDGAQDLLTFVFDGQFMVLINHNYNL